VTGAGRGNSSAAVCAVAVGVTSSLGGIIPGEGSGNAPGIESIAGVTVAGLPCGIAANDVTGGISILCGGKVCARFGILCSGASSDGLAAIGASSIFGSTCNGSFWISAVGTLADAGSADGVTLAASDKGIGCLDTGPRLATIAAASADIGVERGFFTSSVVGVEGPDFSLGKRGLLSAGDRLEGTVLLRCTPEVDGVAKAGVIGLGTAPECRDRFEDVDTFLRTPLFLRMLSAAALEAADADRPIPELFRPGVVGVLA
jgi:hypothetical protein